MAALPACRMRAPAAPRPWRRQASLPSAIGRLRRAASRTAAPPCKTFGAIPAAARRESVPGLAASAAAG